VWWQREPAAKSSARRKILRSSSEAATEAMPLAYLTPDRYAAIQDSAACPFPKAFEERHLRETPSRGRHIFSTLAMRRSRGARQGHALADLAGVPEGRALLLIERLSLT
jgi:hypothetical protein